MSLSVAFSLILILILFFPLAVSFSLCLFLSIVSLYLTIFSSHLQGGIRGVVWTDAFQLTVVWAGLLALMFKAASDVGGWGRVWEISNEGGRLPKFE